MILTGKLNHHTRMKHAFGNYFDILKEVSHSPMMGEMLGFVDSISRAFNLKDSGELAFPDENFSRELMQVRKF